MRLIYLEKLIIHLTSRLHRLEHHLDLIVENNSNVSKYLQIVARIDELKATLKMLNDVKNLEAQSRQKQKYLKPKIYRVK